MSLASLPMYDLPEAAAATDGWWQAIARAMRREGIADVPERLTRSEDYMGAWARPDLLLSQACGYPLTHAFRNSLTYVATPTYAAEGCGGANYCSFVIVRDDDPAETLAGLRGRRAAINGTYSHSGHNILRAMLAPLARGVNFFSEVKTSRSHIGSIEMVSSGGADVAAIDNVTLGLVGRYRPALRSKVRILARSPSAPGLPYVTACGKSKDGIRRLRDSLKAAHDDPAARDTREQLLISGVEVLSDSAYAAIDRFEGDAIAAGYPEIR